jgi:hypothetical protein
MFEFNFIHVGSSIKKVMYIFIEVFFCLIIDFDVTFYQILSKRILAPFLNLQHIMWLCLFDGV